MIKIKSFILILSLLFILGCNSDKKKVENKPNENDDKTMESYYKQFDSTLTKEKVDSLNTSLDSIYKWRDTKRKGGL